MGIRSAEDIPEDGDEKTVMGVQKEKKGQKKSKKEKKSRVKEENQLKHNVEKENAKCLDLMVEKGCTEHANANSDKSKDDVKKDKKMKKKLKGDEMSDEKPRVGTSIENVGSEHAKRDRRERAQSSKSKESKQKRKHDKAAAKGSAAADVVKSKDKKRMKERSVVLEEVNQIKTNKTGEKRDVKEKRRKGSDDLDPDHSGSATVGEKYDLDGKNGKKKKKSKKTGEKFVADSKNEKSKISEQKIAEESDVDFQNKRNSEQRIGEKSDVDGKSGKNKRESEHKIREESDIYVKNDTKKRKREQKIGEESDIDGKNGEKKRRSEQKSGVEYDGDGKNNTKKRKSEQNIGEAYDIDGKNAQKKRSEQKIGEESDVHGNNGKKKRKGKQKIREEARPKEQAVRLKEKGRRVSFADDVEIFSLDGDDHEEVDNSGESKIVHGKRFTPEEDATLMEAMLEYAEIKQLGEGGLEMIRHCSKHPEVKGCWPEIAKSLPHRPVTAIYTRARVLIDRGDKRKWTPEEYELIRRSVEANGADWITLGKELGRFSIHVKDTWRRIKHKNWKKGAWTQDEYQTLFDLVNMDLRMKAHQEKNHGHRQIRDNISWDAISDKMTTRNHKSCCMKWYQQLASPLVKEGLWSDADDYRLVEALQKVDSVCVEDVDWENLLEHSHQPTAAAEQPLPWPLQSPLISRCRGLCGRRRSAAAVARMRGGKIPSPSAGSSGAEVAAACRRQGHRRLDQEEPRSPPRRLPSQAAPPIAGEVAGASRWSGEVCRRRWNQMVRNIGGHREKPFIEQMEVLSKRYCLEMLDYRK